MRSKALVTTFFIGGTLLGISAVSAFPINGGVVGKAVSANSPIESVRVPHSHCWNDAQNHRHCSAARTTTCRGNQCRGTRS
jgi:hypothetical protein